NFEPTKKAEKDANIGVLGLGDRADQLAPDNTGLNGLEGQPAAKFAKVSRSADKFREQFGKRLLVDGHVLAQLFGGDVGLLHALGGPCGRLVVAYCEFVQREAPAAIAKNDRAHAVDQLLRPEELF